LLWTVTGIPFDLYAVDINSGIAYYRGSFRFFFGEPKEWESEGMTIWDLTGREAPGIDGHLHIQFLWNRVPEDDNLVFWHLRATTPEAL
jgi:hypothetical protein